LNAHLYVIELDVWALTWWPWDQETSRNLEHLEIKANMIGHNGCSTSDCSIGNDSNYCKELTPRFY